MRADFGGATTVCYLESDKRNTAGCDHCNTHAPAETGQFSVGLQSYPTQSSILGAVQVNREPVRWCRGDRDSMDQSLIFCTVRVCSLALRGAPLLFMPMRVFVRQQF